MCFLSLGRIKSDRINLDRISVDSISVNQISLIMEKMKKNGAKRTSLKAQLCMLLVSALLLTLAGCKKNTTETETESPSAQMLTQSIQPNTMKIDELMGIANAVLNFEEGYEFGKQYAEIWDEAVYEGDNEIVYFFDRGDYETGLFADRETDAFLYCYFRTLLDNEVSFAGMTLVAGVFLAILEPNEHERMLSEVGALPNVRNEHTENKSEGDEVESKESRGELWTIVVQNSLISITPIGWGG